jgi:hypothetical protein
VVDALFLAKDAAALLSAPSAGNAAWVLLDVLCFADPTGSASASTHTLKAARLAERAHSIKGGRSVIREFRMNHRSGSYTVHFKSGMKYHGEGSLARARQSYRRTKKMAKETFKRHEELDYIHWKPAKSQKKGFIQEASRIRKDGGIGKDKVRNYNKVNSPGHNYLSRR